MADVAPAIAVRPTQQAPAAPRSPSPWSRFLSPSLFSQRSTPGGQPTSTAAPSPLKESTTVPHQPGLFTHAKEINPFERSFAIVEPLAHTLPPTNDATATGQHDLHQDYEQARGGAGGTKRKRAFSSPAVLTPGGSTHPFAGGAPGDEDRSTTLADFIQKAKRPTLSMHNQDSGVGMLDDRDFGAGPSPYSLRSSANNSFDSTTGSSVLRRRRRGLSLSESPDTSTAPSPPSPPKQGPTPPNGLALRPPPPLPAAPNAATAARTSHDMNGLPHFQAQPMPFAMPIVPSTNAFAHAALYPSAPAPLPVAVSIAPDAVVAPPPPGAPPPSFGYAGPVAPGPVSFAPPIPMHGQHGVGFAPLEAHLQQYFDPSFGAGVQLPFDPALVPQGQAMFPNGPANATLRQQPYSGYPSLLPPPPPVAAPPHVQAGPTASVAPGGRYTAPYPASSNGASGSVAATSMSPAAQGPSPSFAPASASASVPAAPASDRSSVTSAPTRLPGPKKRGRKPKNWDPATEQTVELDPEEQEKQRKLALERNRVAASKSRRRKKERVELLENAAAELCTRNVALQAECRTLLAEMHNLRTYMTQAHPPGACSCQHVNGYLAREAEGGGIPAILYGAGKTLERDYTHPPKWSSEDDALAGAEELRALEAITRDGGKLGEPHEMMLTTTTTLNKNGAAKGSKGAAAKGKAQQAAASRDMDVDELKPVVGRAKGAIPIRGSNSSGGPKNQPSPNAKRPGMATRRSSSNAVNAAMAAAEDSENDSDNSDHAEDDDGESEAEHIALKSRRARAIPLRKVA
ncbi:hypothetical protein JCM10908_003480 [Rhodotorula pacifica]|uniref:bZIP transcription factor n=1 Tax=Rhodotorula pacifica TaxID=1495444 RepID=UPI0031734EF6